jgi:hypothetical protein
MAVQQVGQRLSSHAEPRSRRRHRDAERLQTRFSNDFSGVRWIVHLHRNLPVSRLVVVDQIDICDVRALKFEHQPPIARNPNRLLPYSLALHRVKPEAGIVQIGRTARGVERRQQNAKPCRVLRIDSPRVSRGEESLQALVAYARDHTPPVTYRLSDLQPFRPASSIDIVSIGRCGIAAAVFRTRQRSASRRRATNPR